jgi:hypothetical protein
MLTTGGVIALVFYFRFRTRREIQTTVRAAIERGQELSPELIEGLMESLTTKHGDLRKGIISLAIGLAIFLAGGFIPDENGEAAFRAIALFPLFVGLGYLGLWFFISRKK